MSMMWKVLVCVGLALAVVALGVALAAFLGLDSEIAQSSSAGTITVDLNQVMLKYDDPMQNMHGLLTYRQVFQDALWWQIMDPSVADDVRTEAFLMVGLLNEGRTTEITQEQYDILIAAVQQVWGPRVVQRLEEDLQ